MKNVFAVLVIFLIGLAIAPSGQPPEDKKREKCNYRIDTSLKDKSEYIKPIIQFLIQFKEISPPCSTCKFTEFGMMTQIGDATHKKISTNVTENNIKISIDHFTINCTCSFKTKPGGWVAGVTQAVWKNFKILITMVIDSGTRNVQIPKLEAKSSMNQQSVTLKCTGVKDYVTSCETAGDVSTIVSTKRSNWCFAGNFLKKALVRHLKRLCCGNSIAGIKI